MNYFRYFDNTFLVVLFLVLLSIGCAEKAADPPTAVSPPTPLPFTLPPGYTASPLPHTFRQPTQFFVQDNQLWVAQLNGGEGEAMGQVVRVNLADGKRTIVIDQLDKPTGIALLDGLLWIATRDELLKLSPDESNSLAVVLTGLPNNGRSNGTLTVTPSGRLLYETSGTKRDDTSGRLWELDPQTGQQRELARGLKNGYAHVFDADGRLWITEIADGSIDDIILPGEINLVVEGADFGWPRCYGRILSGPDCNGVRPAVAILPEHSTPTSIAVSPFANNSLLVALWMTGEVVEIVFELEGDNAVGEIRPFLTDLQNPQHLITHQDGTVWVSEFRTGRIWVLEKSSNP